MDLVHLDVFKSAAALLTEGEKRRELEFQFLRQSICFFSVSQIVCLQNVVVFLHPPSLFILKDTVQGRSLLLGLKSTPHNVYNFSV